MGTAKTVNTQGTPDEKYCPMCDYYQDGRASLGDSFFQGRIKPPAHTCSTGQTAEQKAYTDSQQDYLAKLYKADRTGRLDTVTTPLRDGAVRVELVNDLDGLLDF